MPTPLTGQIAVTGTPAPLSPAPIASSVFEITAPATNAGNVFIGASGVTLTTGHCLAPGATFTYQRSDQHGEPKLQLNVSDFYAVGTSPDVLTWFASQ